MNYPPIPNHVFFIVGYYFFDSKTPDYAIIVAAHNERDAYMKAGEILQPNTVHSLRVDGYLHNPAYPIWEKEYEKWMIHKGYVTIDEKGVRRYPKGVV